jgi:hypothetical protein
MAVIGQHLHSTGHVQMGLCEHGAHQVPKVLYQSQKKPSKVAFPSKSWIFLPFF